MKEENRVPGASFDTIYFRGNPHLLQNVSFVRDPEHNCQVVIFATMTPVAVPEARQAIVDDMIAQLAPDDTGGLIENTLEALESEYERLEPLYLNSEFGKSHAERDKISMMLDDISDEIYRRELELYYAS